MFRGNSPSDFDTSSYAGSIQSNGYSTLDEVSSQVSGLSRPSAKSIYLQRKDYVTTLNKMMDKFQYRVEHLFSCELDGKELRNVKDCVERLKLLEQMGRVWGQEMLLEVRGANLLLTDIQTKEELEVLALNEVQDLKALLNVGGFNSLLTVTVQSRRKRITTVLMFQCEDVRADYIERNLLQALLRRREEIGSRRAAPSEDTEVVPGEPWADPDYIDEQEIVLPQDEEEEAEARMPNLTINEEEPPLLFTEQDRNVDTLNHILNDVEIFIGKLAVIEAKNAKNAKKKKKKKKGKALEDMPSEQVFKEILTKIKHGFNLLGLLNGHISNPSAPEILHSLFSALAFLVSHCAVTLPSSIFEPVLLPLSVRLMREEAEEAEEKLWRSLGDAWNFPSSQWTEDNEEMATFDPEFFDSWQPPQEMAPSEFSDAEIGGDSVQSVSQKRIPKGTPPRKSPRKSRSGLSRQRFMLVKYDFTSRNHKELTVTKGETVEVLDMSKQWWMVRNSQAEEGFVPNNVLTDPADQSDEETQASVLTKKSKPAEVKAWLQDKGFTKITVRCLGGLSGSMLLGMSREELKMVCPEEGGRVFFQLQTVKSSMAAIN